MSKVCSDAKQTLEIRVERKRNLKLGELAEVSFRIYKLGELGEVIFGMVKFRASEPSGRLQNESLVNIARFARKLYIPEKPQK